MRPIVIFTLAALVFTVGEPIRADQPVYQSGLNPYAAGACAAPNYGAADIQQPCNHCPSPCCDDVWAGYCQEKQQGFCLPCIRPACLRPFARRCETAAKASCSECEAPAEASPPMTTSKPESAPAPKAGSKPTPAPELPPPPASPEPLPDMSESESPSDTTSVPFPMFNPSAWKIGEAVK